MDLLDRLLGHDHWSTAQLLRLCEALTDEQLDQPFDIGHRTLRDTFDHMIYNVQVWTGLMVRQMPDLERDASSVAVLTDRHERASEFFGGAARRVCDEGRLDDTFVDHFNYPQSVGGTILHVINHNSGHRAEILHILERLGVPDLPEIDPQVWEHDTGMVSNDPVVSE